MLEADHALEAKGERRCLNPLQEQPLDYEVLIVLLLADLLLFGVFHGAAAQEHRST
ncbi:MAG: hypothetical protein M3Y55_07180 [Pseudomonadota bacterium]|nr:hypothetical protein [Pseudomonadota bacterium]